MSKEILLIKDIISQYHPIFSESKDLKRLAKKHPEYFNVCSLVEESMAAASGGKYKFVNGAHADFSDGSDSKTSSINLQSSRGEFGNVVSPGGFYKSGALRCVVYNPFSQSLMYYFLPKKAWETEVNFHPTTNFGRIIFSYNRNQGRIVKFDQYRCNSFIDLARA